MATPFPGMDPYLEHPDLWRDVHHRLIVALADDLAPRLRPRYRVKVEVRVYAAMPDKLGFIGVPDAGIIQVNEPALAYRTPTRPRTVELLVPDVVEEGYLEIQEVVSGEVITVIEILSPANKRSGEGRRFYETKRGLVLASATHLVEIDLLRAYQPMPASSNGSSTHYRILVSHSHHRPKADLYAFDVQEPIPTFPMPLRPAEEEPTIDLNQLLHDLYDRAGYDLSIDYHCQPVPPFEEEDAAWVEALLAPCHNTSENPTGMPPLAQP
jgi:hypothetical protein